MNIDRINYVISIMEQAQNLDMRVWQNRTGTGDKYATSIEELHTCGNTACFAGYIAVSPLFQSVGGSVGEGTGTPLLGDKGGEDALLDFFELPSYMKPFICALVYGGVGALEVGVPMEDQKEDPYQYRWRLVEQINELVGYTRWHYLKPKHVITVLLALGTGEFHWLREYQKEVATYKA